jgi:hypothetical protein
MDVGPQNANPTVYSTSVRRRTDVVDEFDDDSLEAIDALEVFGEGPSWFETAGLRAGAGTRQMRSPPSRSPARAPRQSSSGT